MGERVTFRSSTGPSLAGIIDVPERAVRGWGVFAHGFTLGKDSPAAARICKQLAADGIGMLRFDALGLGGSKGDWGDGSFTVKVDDIVKACEFMADRVPSDERGARRIERFVACIAAGLTGNPQKVQGAKV
jgi:alpha/beta superfamily hydrolase